MEGELVGMLADAVPHALVVISVISLGTGWGGKNPKRGQGIIRGCTGVVGERKEVLVSVCISGKRERPRRFCKKKGLVNK